MDENQKQLNNQGGLKTIRTYLSDMADTVRANEASVIKVALAEQKRHERDMIYKKMEGTPFKKFLWVLGGIILIAGAIYGTIFISKEKEKKDILSQVVIEKALVSYDKILSIDINETDDLIEKINTAKNELMSLEKQNLLGFISITKQIAEKKEKVGVAEFFSKMNFRAPSSLVRSLSDSYMVGVYNKDETPPNSGDTGLFIILQPKDYTYVYAGMLEWEELMASDMFDLFSLNTTESKIQISEKQFKDILINNKDVRVLYNEEKVPILYYVFSDKNNLIITDNENTLREIISRLIIKNIKPL